MVATATSVAWGPVGRVVGERAGAGDNFAAGQVAHQQVVAVRVVAFMVESGPGIGQIGAEFLGEYSIAQALRGHDVFAVCVFGSVSVGCT